MGFGLRGFIQAVRGAKTLSEERRIIQKESASIRSSFRGNSSDSYKRRINVAKLLYLFTLGERTQFGQIECLKMLASPKFSDKRLGYLGTMLLLDENQQVLTLVINSLQNDLKSQNDQIVGLALCTFGNIASAEMARDLYQTIKDLLESPRVYIKKKVILCVMKICIKAPELTEVFAPCVLTLLKDTEHAILYNSLSLAMTVINYDKSFVNQVKPMSGHFINLLRTMSSGVASADLEVQGFMDPFLQVKLIKFIGILGKTDVKISEQVNSLMAEICTRFEVSKNVANSILYECVSTIFTIEADSALRVLGINVLGKFLSHRDNNIRYVALNLLSKVIKIEPKAVQRHRSTVFECLRDPDSSIQRRALDIALVLINENNIKHMVGELLEILKTIQPEFKIILTTQIGIAADWYAPNKWWHIDTLISMLEIAGKYVEDVIITSTIRLVASTSDLQEYASKRFFYALQKDSKKQGQTICAVWMIGEYADLLNRRGSFSKQYLNRPIKDTEIFTLLETILSDPDSSAVVKNYVLMAMAKLSTRFKNPWLVKNIESSLIKFQDEYDEEIQQRAIEFCKLISTESIKDGILERMPPYILKKDSKVLISCETEMAQSKSYTDNLVDLIKDEHVEPNLAIENTIGNGIRQENSFQLAWKMYCKRFWPEFNESLITDKYLIFRKNNIELELQQFNKLNGKTFVLILFSNNSMENVNSFNLEAAVPKSLKLKINPASADSLAMNSSAAQLLEIEAGDKKIKIRLRFTAVFKTQIMQEQIDQSLK